MSIFHGQTLGVVGESGCGKSVTAMTALRLVPSPPSRVDRGRMVFAPKVGPSVDLLRAADREIRAIRGNRIAMIFQEPMTSLNPVFSVGEQVVEAIRLHQDVGRSEAWDRAGVALREVGIGEPERRLRQYPHAFSGGMRQRVMIAMALACRPDLLLADEPTTALDVTVQAQILDTLDGIRQDRGLAVMLITHDLGVVSQRADVVCVMYGGRVVEYGRTDDLFGDAMHPYTRALLACVPRLGSRRERLATVRSLIDEQVRESRGRLGLGVVPWWPWHEAPGDAVRDEFGEAGYRLARVSADRYVGVWSTPAAAALETGVPRLSGRRRGV